MRFSLAASLMLSSVLLPTVAMASEPAPATATAQPVRISTGVIAPALSAPITIEIPDRTPKPLTGEIALSILVDANGSVHDVKVTHSMNAFWDARVVEAVERSHFRPASLDHQAIPMNVDLTVNVAR